MPLSSVSALVLQASPLNEQDKWVMLLTQKGSILKGVAPGACRIRNRFGSLLELFTCGRFFYYWKEDREMVTISKADLGHSFFPVVAQAENIFYFYLQAEILIKFVPWRSGDERLYSLTLSLLKSAEAGRPAADLLLYFLVWICHIEGVLFNPSACVSCGARLSEGWSRSDFKGVLCRRCRRDEKNYFSVADLDLVRAILSHAPERIAEQAMAVDNGKLLRFFTRKIEYHGEFSLRTLQYLKEFR